MAQYKPPNTDGMHWFLAFIAAGGANVLLNRVVEICIVAVRPFNTSVIISLALVTLGALVPTLLSFLTWVSLSQPRYESSVAWRRWTGILGLVSAAQYFITFEATPAIAVVLFIIACGLQFLIFKRQVKKT